MQSSKTICTTNAVCLLTLLALGTAYAQQVAPRPAQPRTGPNCEWARDLGVDTILYGTDGDDAICAVDEDCEWAEAIGMNVLRSTDDNDFICPGHGNDYVNAGYGNDEIFVDPFRKRLDRPRIAGENGFKRLYGGPGDDFIMDARNSAYIVGGCGRDLLSGGNGNDVIYGYLPPGEIDPECTTADRDWDSLNGDHGNDVLIGGLGINELIGGGDYNYCDGLSAPTEFQKGCTLCWGSHPDNKVRKGALCNNLRR